MDSFAVGAILFELAKGSTPFLLEELPRSNYTEKARERVQDALEGLDEDFFMLVANLLEWDPEDRKFVAEIVDNLFFTG